MEDTEGLRYDDLILEQSLVFARRGEKEVRFTRRERALLQLFTRHPRQLLHRSQILDALSYTGSDSSDRTIDFLVNRLRSKLGDDARHPRFIATQYGEGYIWIAANGSSHCPPDTSNSPDGVPDQDPTA